jgi:hypothetical protein
LNAAAGRRVDLLVVAVLAAASYVVIVHYVRQAVAAGFKAEYYQFEFGPAVMLACGHGFVSPAEGEIPVLDQFLNLQRDAMQCADLTPAPKLRRLSNLQSVWKSQLWMTAEIWKFGGISWSSLVVLSGMYFAATVALAYTLARLVSGRIAALLVAIGVLVSPLHWSQVPHLRDYSKAPFMMGVFILLALLVRNPVLPRRVLVLAAGFGLLIGVGFGFRSDLLIVAPAFVVAIVVFLPGGILRNGVLKAKTLAVAFVAFAAAAWPLFGSYADGGGLQVVALLGFVSQFDRPLEVERGPYEFGYVYSDWYLGAVIREFGWREQHVADPIPLYRAQYNRAGNGVIRGVATTLPADILARAYASLVSIARLPASNWTDSHAPPQLPHGGFWDHVFMARARLFGAVAWLWPTAVILSLVAASLADVRVACFVAFLLLYFGGYPGIQFHERHFFHLDVVPLVAVAAVASRLRRAVAQGGAGIRAAVSSGAVARSAAFCLVFLLLMVTPLLAARAYQTSRVRATLEERLAAPRESLQLTEQPVSDARVILETGVLPADIAAKSHAGVVTSEYLLARVGGDRCDALRLPVTLRYRAPFPRGDFSRTMEIAMPTQSSAPVHVLAPVFYRYRLSSDVTDPTDRSSAYQFRGFEIAAADKACVLGVDRLIDTERFPLLLSATLTPEWQRTELYQTIAALEHRSRPADALTTFAAPGTMRVSKDLLSSSLRPLTVTARADALTPAGVGGWRMDGTGSIGAATGPYGYLLTTAGERVRAGDQLVVEGVMRGGGLSVGLIRSDQWLVQTSVVAEGRFLAVVEVPSDGTVNVVIANNLSNGATANRFDIIRAGWHTTTNTTK